MKDIVGQLEASAMQHYGPSPNLCATLQLWMLTN